MFKYIIIPKITKYWNARTQQFLYVDRKTIYFIIVPKQIICGHFVNNI